MFKTFLNQKLTLIVFINLYTLHTVDLLEQNFNEYSNSFYQTNDTQIH